MGTPTCNHECANFQSPVALGPDIKEGAVNRIPLQALFILPRGGYWYTTVTGAILSQPTDYARGLVSSSKIRPPATATGCPIGCG